MRHCISAVASISSSVHHSLHYTRHPARNVGRRDLVVAKGAPEGSFANYAEDADRHIGRQKPLLRSV